jgi:hypothetical protein
MASDRYARYQHLLVDSERDGVALVTLNRPEVLNATNNVLHRELTEIWRDLDRDPAVRVILVTGAGSRRSRRAGRVRGGRTPARLLLVLPAGAHPAVATGDGVVLLLRDRGSEAPVATATAA